MAATESAVDNVGPSSTAIEEKSSEEVSEKEAPEVKEPAEVAEATKVAKDFVNGEKQEGPAIECNAEDIKSEEEEDIEGSLVLDDFLDSLDVLDSWNPDEDELEGIGDDQTQQLSDKEKKNRDDKHRRDKSRDRGRRSRRDLDDRRSTRKRSGHRDRSGGDTFDLLGLKAVQRRRSVHRECSLERPSRSRHHIDGKEVKDLRDLLSRRDHKDVRDHQDRSRDKAKDYRRGDRDRERDRHREKEKSKEKTEKVEKLKELKELKVENEAKPPPGILPAPRLKMPSDDLVPPGTEDEFWPKEDIKVEPPDGAKNGSVKDMEADCKSNKSWSGASRAGSSPSNKRNCISFSNAGRAELLGIARECLKRRGDSEEASLARTWACKLKRMKCDQKLLAEKFINDILFEAELGTLHRNSVAINNNVTLTSSPATSVHLDSSP